MPYAQEGLDFLLGQSMFKTYDKNLKTFCYVILPDTKSQLMHLYEAPVIVKFNIDRK